jgi:5-formaminoimidazole-4-carboxamide-1-(beta)-D-ribofuranosyl 5'-monophosphate synthetase
LRIATIGSHCALQLMKGAKDEGFKTVLICKKERKSLYRRFKFVDEIFEIEQNSETISSECQEYLKENGCILIPHGSLVAYSDIDYIEHLSVPIFGNKWILRWEADRNLKQELMSSAGLTTPQPVKSKHDIDRLCIVKLHGAAGGRGYFLAWNRETFEKGALDLLKQNVIKSEDDLYIQEYVRGVPVYLHYFYSAINNEIEFLGVDRRYETDIDGLGRIPASHQLGIGIQTSSYNVIGNFPLVLRESLLGKVFSMGEDFVRAAKQLVPPGMIGPFCLEGVCDALGNFVTFEFSARIVAGTNLYIMGSPYSCLIYDDPMSMGRRIALEIKNAQNNADMKNILT